jgi:glucosamine-phosphate N-acetyltransferase
MSTNIPQIKFKINPLHIELKKLQNDSCVSANDITHLLSQLTFCYALTDSQLLNFRDYLRETPSHMVYVIYYHNRLVGMITLMLERKLIHNNSNVLHIEDFVIDKVYRGIGLGIEILNIVKNIAMKYSCYKIILNCDEYVQEFYEKADFVTKNLQMAYYL